MRAAFALRKAGVTVSKPAFKEEMPRMNTRFK